MSAIVLVTVFVTVFVIATSIDVPGVQFE